MQLQCDTHVERNIRRVLPDGLSEMNLKMMHMHELVAFFIGRRNSGKSQLMRYVIRKRRKDIDMVVVFCLSEGANGFYANMMIPCKFIHTTYSVDKLIGVINVMKRYPHLRKLLVFDDMGYLGKSFWNSAPLKELMFAGRHFKIGLMFAVQYVMHIPIDARFNFTHAFVMMDNALDIIHRINNTFFSFIRPADFLPIFQTFTRDHLAIVSLGESNRHNVGECMRWIKSDMNCAPFLIGTDIYRSFYAQWQIDQYIEYHENIKKRQ
jgi:hypothetical protein